MPFIRAGQAEIDAALVVGFRCGRDVEVREWNFFGMLRRERPQRLADDSVILHFLPTLIAEYQHGGRSGFGSFCLVRGRRRRTRIQVLIALLAHPLLIEVLLVHLVGQAYLILLILIVRGAGIPPPIRIERAVAPRISVAAAAVSVAIISEPVSADSQIVRTIEAARIESP